MKKESQSKQLKPQPIRLKCKFALANARIVIEKGTATIVTFLPLPRPIVPIGKPTGRITRRQVKHMVNGVLNNPRCKGALEANLAALRKRTPLLKSITAHGEEHSEVVQIKKAKRS